MTDIGRNALACTVAIMALFAASAGVAQSQQSAPVKPQPAPAGSEAAPQDDTTITIFGKPKSRVAADGLTTIDLSKTASGCGFMTRNPEQDLIDSYFDDMYGGDEVDGQPGGTDPAGSSRQRLNANSPYGDVSTPDSGPPLSPDAQSDDPNAYQGAACSQADTNFALGRTSIYAHDHTLKDAFAALNNKDYPRALDLFKKAYDKLGDFPEYDVAALTVGKMYLLGVGTKRDTAQAIIWLKKALIRPVNPFGPERQTFRPETPEAMNVRSEAYMTLAKIYVSGWGVPKNPAEAVHWFRAADEWGFIPATHLMGRAYRTGYGVPRDTRKALTYFTRAATVGYAPSQYAMGEIYYYGENGVPQDKVTAGGALVAAAKNGLPDALYAVGRMYELGEGGAERPDPVRALVYYKEAALKGQSDAQNVLAIAFYNGNGVPKNLETARQWFLKAAQSGNPDAMFNLAAMMTKGEGGPKDLVRAYAWFALADRSGEENAAAAMKQVAAMMTPEALAEAEALVNPQTKPN
jgi:TPR repeat protein